MDLEKSLRVSELLDLYSLVLTEKQRDVLDLYYNEDYSLSEIAEHERTTRQAVHDIIKRSEENLFELEEKIRLAEKTAVFMKFIEEVIELSSDMIKSCAETGAPRPVSKRAEYLKEAAQKTKDGFTET
jgi:predicted DNA-binding protein YlxM (UPF0122 family)